MSNPGLINLPAAGVTPAPEYHNPTPVATGLVPVCFKGELYLLSVVRANAIGFGLLGLPGGYVDYRENFEDATTRELREETGLIVQASEWLLRASHANQRNNVIVFSELTRIIAFESIEHLMDFKSDEVNGLKLIGPDTPAEDIAFPLHRLEIGRFFERNPRRG